ncbi:hypothetical protein Tco_1026355 [Tanacetum coccineum]
MLQRDDNFMCSIVDLLRLSSDTSAFPALFLSCYRGIDFYPFDYEQDYSEGKASDVHRIASAFAKRPTHPNVDPEVFQMRHQHGARIGEKEIEAKIENSNESIKEFPCLGVCCCLAKIIDLDTSSKKIDYDSPDYRGPPKSLLKWYGYLSDEYKDKGGNESDAKPSFLDISKAKACMLAKAQASDASSKA